MVDEAAAWYHRVASLDHPDEDLAGQLERLAGDEAGRGRLALAATHLLWASDISPARADRERRLLTAVVHLMLSEEARGLALRQAVEASASRPCAAVCWGPWPSPRGNSVRPSSDSAPRWTRRAPTPTTQPLAALIANRLAGTYTLLGEGEKVMTWGRWALDTGCLDAAASSQTRTLVAIGASQLSGPRPALARARLPRYRPRPGRAGPRRWPVVSGGLPAAGREPVASRSRPVGQRQAGPPRRHLHPRAAGVFLSGSGPVSGRCLG